MKTYLTGVNGLAIVEKWVPNCWVNIEQPTQSDNDFLLHTLEVPESFLKDIEDSDERPRIELENNWQMIILKVPINDRETGYDYNTIPLGILIKDDYFITICHYKIEMIPDFILYNQRKQIGFDNPYDLVLKLMLSSAVWFLKYLKQLNICIKRSEKELEKSVRNKELQALLQIEKCFVFFITGLKGNNILLHRIKNDKRNKSLINENLLEDVEIEIQQALEMANIHSDILSGMMDAYASVISNNMNDVMKQLTSISIILMIPTLIASFYGMNVPNPLENNSYGLIIITIGSIVLSALSVFLFRFRKKFNKN